MSFDTGIPNIRVVIREASNENLTVDVPNVSVNIQPGSQYNVNIIPNTVTTLRTGSFNTYADFAGIATTASYVSGSGIIAGFATSASYALTASYISGVISTWNDIQNKPDGLVSSSTQILNYNIFATTGSNTFTGTQNITGTLSITGGITGSLLGTSSWASNAISASYVSGSTAIGPGTVQSIALFDSTSTISSSIIYQSSNKIGIGTTSPTSSLHVSSNATIVTIEDFNSGQPTSIANVEYKYNSGSLGYVGYSGLATGALDIWNYYSLGNIRFGTNNIERVRIDPTGRIGIGTISPSASIQVQGNQVISASSAQTSSLDIAHTWSGSGVTYNSIKLNVTDTTSAVLSNLIDLQVGGSSKFLVGKTGRIDTQADIRVFGSGAVRIINNSGYFSLGAADDVVLNRDSADVLAQRRTTNPQTFRIYNTFTDLSNFERGKLEWSGNIFNIGTEQSGSGTARNLALQTSGSTRVFISSSGNVGIGTTNPENLLHISRDGGASTIRLLRIDNSNVTHAQNLYLDMNTSKDVLWSQGSGNGGTFWDAGTRGYGFSINATRIVTFDQIGNISASGYTSSRNNAVGFLGTASWAQSSSVAITASAANSITFTPATASYAQNANLLDGLDSTVFATTGSNLFIGTQSISNTTNSTFWNNGALTVAGGVGIGRDVNISGSVTILGLLTAVSQSTQYVTSSQLIVADNKIIVNVTDLQRFGGLSVIDSGSTSPATASIYWDSLNHNFIYENLSGSGYNSAIFIAGPQNYGPLGNEVGLTTNRIPVAVGSDHIDSRPQSSSIRVDFPSRLTHIEAGLVVTGSITAQGGLTGSILGTSSYALNAATASVASNVGPGTSQHIALFNSTNSISSSIIFQSGSNIGIGTITPQASLDIVSANNVTPFKVKSTGITGTGIVMSLLNGSDDLLLSVQGNGVTYIRGNVGIGTTTPQTKLDVRGGLAIGPFVDSIPTMDGGSFIGSTSGSGTYPFNEFGNLILASRTNGTGRDILFYTGTTLTSRMIVDRNGNVGIGLTSPSALLHVSGANNTTPVRVSIGNNATYNFSGNSTSGYITTFNMDDVGSSFGHNSSTRDLQLRTNSTARLTILGGGNVGIGTTSPTTLLHVSASGTTNDLLIGSTTLPKLFVSGAGNIGIGTTTPARRVEITGDGTGTAQLRLTYVSGQSGLEIMSNAASIGELRFGIAGGASNLGQVTYNNANNAMAFFTNAGQRVTIDSSGRMGIGTTSPSASLHVQGNVSASSYTSSISNAVGFFGTASWAASASVATGFAGTANRVLYNNASNVTTTSANLTFDGTNLTVGGQLNAATKSFLINHRTKPGKKLVYGVAEGPEHSVFIRGRLKGTNTIVLPNEWDWLVDLDSITVQLTPIGKPQKLYVKSIDRLYITVENGGFFSGPIDCYYFIQATRKDVDPLQTVV